MTVSELNRLELSKLCLEKLKQVGAEWTPDSLYAMQLLVWLLEERAELIGLPMAKFLPELEAFVQVQTDNDQAFPFLLRNYQEEDQTLEEKAEVEAQEVKDLPPESVAQCLLENLYENLSEFTPSLREY